MDHDAGIAAALALGQRVGSARPPLPRRRLGRGVVTLLVMLRVYVLVAVPIVAYAFIHALAAGQP